MESLRRRAYVSVQICCEIVVQVGVRRVRRSGGMLGLRCSSCVIVLVDYVDGGHCDGAAQLELKMWFLGLSFLSVCKAADLGILRKL